MSSSGGGISQVKKRKRIVVEKEEDAIFSMIDQRGSFLPVTEKLVVAPPQPQADAYISATAPTASKEDIDRGFQELDNLKKEKEKTDQKELDALWKEAARIWKERVCTTWYLEPGETHNCSSTPVFCPEREAIRKLPYSSADRQKRTGIHQTCQVCTMATLNTCEMDLIYAVAWKDLTNMCYHVCFPTLCKSQSNLELHCKKIHVIDYLYICRKTGLYHACTTTYCKARQTNRKTGSHGESGIMCPISGRAHTSELLVEESSNNVMLAKQRARHGIENVLRSSVSTTKQNIKVLFLFSFFVIVFFFWSRPIPSR